MRFQVVCPEENVGAVLGDLARRRAEIRSIDQGPEGLKLVEGIVPLATTFGWANDLRSLTSGRGSQSVEPHDYALAPDGVVS
jgi:elongation factor G